ncbi:hypothetical protein ATY79_29230 [Rhizobium sp. R693]|nr:hypothetical protein ATY79_29230 [Rhizobium sp. R693]
MYAVPPGNFERLFSLHDNSIARRLTLGIVQGWSSAEAFATGTCGLKAGASALPDQAPLELSHRSEHMKNEAAAGRGGVYIFCEAYKIDFSPAELFNDLNKFRHRH